MNKTYAKPQFRFMDSEESYDIEINQHIVNGLKMNNFTFFLGQLTDLSYD
jgi:hypothetical protein